MREKVIKELVKTWRQLVEDGDFDAEEMITTLEEQIDGEWDGSLEDLESNPELGEMMGYGEELTEEQENEWLGIVNEAARRYLDELA